MPVIERWWSKSQAKRVVIITNLIVLFLRFKWPFVVVNDTIISEFQMALWWLMMPIAAQFLIQHFSTL